MGPSADPAPVMEHGHLIGNGAHGGHVMGDGHGGGAHFGNDFADQLINDP